MMPVVACVAGGANGEVFNVNGDSMAVAIASSWEADRLVFLTDVPGVLDASKTIIPALTIADCQALIESGVATGGMQAKLNAAMRCRGKWRAGSAHREGLGPVRGPAYI